MTKREVEKSETLWFNKSFNTQYNPSPCTFQGWAGKEAMVRYPEGFINNYIRPKDLYPTEAALRKGFTRKIREALKKHREVVKRANERAEARETALKVTLASVKTHEAIKKIGARIKSERDGQN